MWCGSQSQKPNWSADIYHSGAIELIGLFFVFSCESESQATGFAYSLVINKQSVTLLLFRADFSYFYDSRWNRALFLSICYHRSELYIVLKNTCKGESSGRIREITESFIVQLWQRNNGRMQLWFIRSLWCDFRECFFFLSHMYLVMFFISFIIVSSWKLLQ